MTSRTNLDVAAEAIRLEWQTLPSSMTSQSNARAALDAIHPALADLTPDDVAAIYAYLAAWYRWERGRVHERPPLQELWGAIPAHAWEVLSHD